MSQAAQPVAPPRAELGRSAWWFVLFMVGIAGAVLLFLWVFVDVPLDAPTLGLAAACAALIGALRGMWGMVFVLTRPTHEVLESEAGPIAAGTSELRDEKQRVLRAIKELEFDHDMGKLSDEDFKQVGDAYRLRAIEILRALDHGNHGVESGELHPLLREHLATLGVEAAPVPKGEG